MVKEYKFFGRTFDNANLIYYIHLQAGRLFCLKIFHIVIDVCLGFFKLKKAVPLHKDVPNDGEGGDRDNNLW